MTHTCLNEVNRNWLAGNEFLFVIDKLPELPIFAQTVILPAISLGEAIINTSVLDYAAPGEKLTFDPLIITFPINETLTNYLEIQDWMFRIADPENVGDRVISQRDIYSDGKLLMLNNQKKVTATYTFKDMFPTNLSEITLDISQPASPVLATVTFKFSRFYLESLDNQSSDVISV